MNRRDLLQSVCVISSLLAGKVIGGAKRKAPGKPSELKAGQVWVYPGHGKHQMMRVVTTVDRDGTVDVTNMAITDGQIACGGHIRLSKAIARKVFQMDHCQYLVNLNSLLGQAL